MSTELKRSVELVLVDLLKEALPSLNFYAMLGGGNDSVPLWQPNTDYSTGDVIRPSNTSFTQSIVVIASGNSGSTEPAFDDVVDHTFGTAPRYMTLDEPYVITPIQDTSPEPPFGVVIIEDAELQHSNIWFLRGHVDWVTQMDRETATQSALEAKSIFTVLDGITGGYDAARHIMVHGMDVEGTDGAEDNDLQARGDIVRFVIGVSQDG